MNASIRLVLSLAVLAAAPACSGSDASGPTRTLDTPLAQSVDVGVMVERHTPFAGDNSRVTDLVDATHVVVIGLRTLALQTAVAPYGLRVDFSSVSAGATRARIDTAMRQRAVLVMACVDNLGSVSWTAAKLSPATGTLTRSEAETMAEQKLVGQCTTSGLQQLIKAIG